MGIFCCILLYINTTEKSPKSFAWKNNFQKRAVKKFMKKPFLLHYALKPFFTFL